MTRLERLQTAVAGANEAGAAAMDVKVTLLDNDEENPTVMVTVADKNVSRSLIEFKDFHDLLQKHSPSQIAQIDRHLSFTNAGLKVSIQNWLDSVRKHKKILQSDEFRAFIGVDDGEYDEDEPPMVGDLFDHTKGPGPFPTPKSRSLCLDDFDLLCVLGKGAFGKVVLGRYKQSGKLYALKQIEKKLVVRKNQVEHTQTERDVLEYIRHPFIVKMHGAFETERKLFLILDYCSGGDLFFHLTKAGSFSEKKARFYVSQLILALEYIHDLGIVFRDLKLENILLDADGNVALADFGLSAEGVYNHMNQDVAMCGTPEYLAPEVLNRTGCGRAVDWWTLGQVLYEMLAGSPPFYSQNQSIMFTRILKGKLQIPFGISATAGDLIKRLLTRDADKRLGSKDGAREVKSHPFFADVDWERLFAKKIPPHDKFSDDTSNFDPAFTSLEIQEDRRISRPMESPMPEFKHYSFLSNEANL